MVEARLPFVVASETTLSPTAGGVGAPMAPSPEVGESVRPLTDDRPERSRRRSLVAQRGPRPLSVEKFFPRLSPGGRPGRRFATAVGAVWFGARADGHTPCPSSTARRGRLFELQRRTQVDGTATPGAARLEFPFRSRFTHTARGLAASFAVR